MIVITFISGIYTGSIYGDAMARQALHGSAVCPVNKTMIVKTHLMSDGIKRHNCHAKYQHAFKKAIYIIRNPYNAILAEFNRLHAGKTKTVTKAQFETKGKHTSIFVFESACTYLQTVWFISCI